MSRFAAIDLSKLPFPEVIETVDAEAIVVEMRADFMAAYPAFTADLESETAVALLEEGAYRETILRARVNDGARAVMLPYATGADLDTLAASMATERAVVDPGDPDALPPVPETLEDDDRLRARAQLAWEGLSVAGPEGAYIYHALSADPRVRDVDARAPTWDRWDITPEAAAVLPAGAIVLICEDAVGLVDPYPGDVAVTILSTEPEGTPSADLLATVAAALNGDDVRPLTDTPRVRAPSRVDYAVVGTLDLYEGPDTSVVIAASVAALAAFVADQERLGEPVTMDGLHKAGRVDGVREFRLSSPVDSIDPGPTGYAHCTGITVTEAGA